jgi:hypothetical protein
MWHRRWEAADGWKGMLELARAASLWLFVRAGGGLIHRLLCFLFSMFIKERIRMHSASNITSTIQQFVAVYCCCRQKERREGGARFKTLESTTRSEAHLIALKKKLRHQICEVTGLFLWIDGLLLIGNTITESCCTQREH